MRNSIYSHSQLYFDDNFQYQNATDMILKDKLIKLLSEFHDECPEVLDIDGTADEIIKLFADSIKNLEFKI